ncbi:MULTISPECIES: hypothetical protein [Micrococcaceae]|uniref:hypothetical protein n=1 Tax=Micrococcaceae TaxID=1268 RepID=UPI0006FC4510|nr:hypothetical protein [Arthrobacter sp. Leaf137]KQQ87712.1 hypothetical protein ASF64_19025 [Arthrobacter sp. Leaf137]MDQ1054757.1 hypothetical protein [Arthrobacter sp. SORGH_AS_0212]
MPSSLPFLARARVRPAAHPPERSGGPKLKAVTAAASALAAVALAGCSSVVSVENADVPQWRTTALPTAPDSVLDDAGKILNRDRIVREAADVPAGNYTLTATCDGGGKAFFAVALNGAGITEAGAACNGSKETSKVALPEAGRLEISTSSVDAPLIYAYQLAPAPAR